jgi:methionine biosynthesis protein MetW
MTKTEIASYPINTCLICGSPGKEKYSDLYDNNYGYTTGWKMTECSNFKCGLLWLNPMPAKEDIYKAYEYYYTHSDQKKSFFNRLQKPYLSVRYNYFQEMPLLKKLAGYFVYLLPTLRNKFDFGVLYLQSVKNGKILDFGCGNGWILDNLKEAGWDCYGLDFDKKAVDFCLSKGLKVNTGDIHSQNYPDNYFDAITINHVIEHVHDVDELLRSCSQKLKKGGRLIIATPNSANWQHKLYGKFWFQLDPPRHLHIFNIHNLETIVNRNNLNVIDSFTSIRMDAWSTTVTRAIKRNGRFNIGKDKKKMSDYLVGLIHQNISYIYTKFNKKAAGEIVLIATKE